MFRISNEKTPAGDQPRAIAQLVDGLAKGMTRQTLHGATGTGKTFTIANVIQQVQKPTLVIAHNKTLAAQLAQEFRDMFPENEVHYFVSYYDYFQPEAYMPASDTYIEKESMINEEIDRLRHASTQALLTRRDVIIVASVSCIYGLGSPAQYQKVLKTFQIGAEANRTELLRDFVNMYFERVAGDLTPGTFRAVGNTIEVMPTSERMIYRMQFRGPVISSITKIDPITRALAGDVDMFHLFPAKHFVTPEDEKDRAMKEIKELMDKQVKKFKKEGKLLEAERIKRRTEQDLAMIREIGYCNGIENYSMHFDGRSPGDAPSTLISYFPRKEDGSPDFLTVIDESHVTLPQLSAMYAGDQARKKTLVDFGFRLPTAKDNRPLNYEEFLKNVGDMIYVSATPGKIERAYADGERGQLVEQIIRPTGLVDPEIEVHGVIEEGKYPGQIAHVIAESEKVIARNARVLITTLTKKMAEDLTDFLKKKGIKTEYIHSDVKTVDRIDILTKFRKGDFDCLVGVNLLREGLDLPEVELVAILDADKEGFLRSETALIQTIGRAARNVNGRVILYADHMTDSLNAAISETNRRREIQVAYNTRHSITPKTIIKEIKDIASSMRTEHDNAVDDLVRLDVARFQKDPEKVFAEKRTEMEAAVAELDFETAALVRDEIHALEALEEVAKKKQRTKKAI